MSTQALLTVLADGEFHSGTELGESLAVSRTAVWKQLKKLEQLGVKLHRVKGRGYRVPGGLQLLEPEHVRSALAPDVREQVRHFQYSLSTGSTNADALAGLQLGRRHGALYVTEHQQAGRGRRGRHWVSPFARNLYFSLVWSFSGGAAALEGLSLAVGVAVATALQNLGLPGVSLKWPNDILLGGDKLGGILLEMTGDASGECQVVIGIGINVAMLDAEADSIEQPWTSVAAHMAVRPDRNQLLAHLLSQLLADLSLFAEQGFAAFAQRWQSFDACYGRPVLLSSVQAEVAGVACGVDASGALLLDVDGQRQVVHGGEISLRMQ